MPCAQTQPIFRAAAILILGCTGRLVAQGGAAQEIVRPAEGGDVALVYETATRPASRGSVPVGGVPTGNGALSLTGVSDGIAAVLSNARDGFAPVVPAIRAGLSTDGELPSRAIAAGTREASPAKLSMSSKRSLSSSLPWVGTVEWEVPQALGRSSTQDLQENIEPWALFEEELDKSRVLPFAPAYARVEPNPLFQVNAPVEGEFERGLKKLFRAKAYRELRHRLKREWRTTFQSDATMSYSDYERRLFQINNIGKDVREQDAFSTQYAATEVKQSFFGKSRIDGELDIALLAWGPFTLNDTGSLKFDLGTAARSPVPDEGIALGEAKRTPLLATKDYRLDTSFNFDVDPFQAASRGDVRAAVRRCGVSIDIDWLSDVLRREILTTQIDLETDLYGDFKGFFNIVIKAR